MATSTADIDAGVRAESAGPQYGRLAAMSWLHFLNDGSANYLPGILPAVLIAVHQGSALAGTVMAALLIGQALQVPSGWIADRVGGRVLVIAGVLGSNLAAAVIGLAPNLWVLIPALVAIGIASASFHPQALAGARQLSGARHGFGMSLFLVGGELGRGIWPLLASLVVVNWGIGYLWMLALPALVSVAALYRTLPKQPPRHPRAAPIAWRAHLVPMSALVVFSVLRALAIFGSVTYLPLMWHERGRGLTEGAALITVMLVVGIIGNIGGGQMADRVGLRPVLLGSSFAGAVLMALFPFTGGPWQWLVLGLVGIATFASLPLSIVIGQDVLPENRSLGSGLALGLSNGLAALALIALDRVSTNYGPQSVLLVLAAALLAAGAMSLLLPRKVGQD